MDRNYFEILKKLKSASKEAKLVISEPADTQERVMQKINALKTQKKLLPVLKSNYIAVTAIAAVVVFAVLITNIQLVSPKKTEPLESIRLTLESQNKILNSTDNAALENTLKSHEFVYFLSNPYQKRS